jgi:Flp pilus assembly protein TadG
LSRTRPARSPSQDARGSASVELVILLPALFAILFLGMQAALYHHARTLAIAAAQEGARAAGAEHGSASDGMAAASAFVTEAGGNDVLVGADTTAHSSATTVTVTVTGHSLSVIPGWSPVVKQSASLPRERLTAP